MSYDLPDDYVPTLPPKRRWWHKPVGWYIGFMLWCALDAKSKRVNAWGMRRLFGKEREVDGGDSPKHQSGSMDGGRPA